MPDNPEEPKPEEPKPDEPKPDDETKDPETKDPETKDPETKDPETKPSGGKFYLINLIKTNISRLQRRLQRMPRRATIVQE
jgi:hypothetical protein